MKTYFILIILFISSFGLFSQNNSSNIDPLINKDGSDEKVMIILDNQVELTNAKLLKGKNKKGNFVYENLYKAAVSSQKELIAFLSANNIEFRPYYIVNAIAITTNYENLLKIANRSDVALIIKDSKYILTEPLRRNNENQRVTEWGLDKINAPDVWNLGFTGQGITVGGQDTGYEWDHPALKDHYKGWDGATANHDYHWHDAIHNAGGSNPCGSDSAVPCDDHNHGTHTMGTMVGDDNIDNQIGVAPGAKWIGCRNMDQGNGTLSTYVECFEWFLAPYPVGQTPAQGDPTKAPHVINNSWTCPPSEGCNSTNFQVMETALNNLKNAGIVVVVSNGNSGSSCSSTNSPPAFFENSFSVGATNSSDVIAGFSSRGPVTIDGTNRLVPIVSAPGVSVRSCIRGDNYASYSGTSMAGPHVVGAVALILSANPNLEGEVDQIENIIKSTTLQLTTNQDCGNVTGDQIPNNTYGYGRIDVLAAVNKAIAEYDVPAIKIDQFGYLPNSTKTAVFSDPVTGYNDTDSYNPPTDVYVKDAVTHETVFTATPTTWNSGLEDPLSGDKVWWLDFSAFTTNGEYYISDNTYFSENFIISDDVYDPILKTAFKTFYLQRCGHDKTSPFIESAYHDASCHLNDVTCKFIDDPNNVSREKDMSGGWHDAGDYNKYVNFAYQPVLDLLFSFEYNPESWNDDMGIPESGNGIPDILDEVKYELDWLLKMQVTDGGVHCIVGVQNYATASPPSADNATRYYGKKTTAATYSTAAMFAMAAIQFKKINNPVAQVYATTLQTKAELAYAWATANPGIIYYNAGTVGAGEQEIGTGYETDMRKLTSEIFLYKLTTTPSYKTDVESNYTNAHLIAWNFVYPFESIIQQSLLYYAHLGNVTPAVSADIINTYKTSVETTPENIPSITNEDDAYRAYTKLGNIVWGSNRVKCNKANIYQVYNHYKINPTNQDLLNESVEDFLHYQHGVNPNGLAYLTNMEAFGADKSINTIYHGWFNDGNADWDDVRTSTYGPAPGFMPGGPNPSWSLDGCCPSGCGGSNADCVVLIPPDTQPALKSYRDWNHGWPQNSWEITENSISYQSAYMLLLSSRVNIAPSLTNDSQVIGFDTENLIIDDQNYGLILKSQNLTNYRIQVNTSGKILTTINPSSSIESSKVIEGSVYIKPVDRYLILTDANQILWTIKVDNSGSISTTNLLTQPTAISKQSNGDIILESNSHGLIIKDETNICYLLEVSDGGALFTHPVECPY